MSPERTLVVGLCGLPGAGKSTVAGPIAERLGFRLVDRDGIRRAQFPLCAFSEDEKRAATDACLAAVIVNCRLGFSSIVDGMTFSVKSERDRFSGEIKTVGASFYVLHLDLPMEEARRRVSEQPDHAAGDRDVNLVDRIAARFESPEGEGLRIDAALPPDAVLERAVRAVELLRGGPRG